MTPARSLCVYCRERPVEPKWRPFCSERCRLLDLSRWLDGDYRIPGESTDDSAGTADSVGTADEADDVAPDRTARDSRYARHHHDHR